MKKATIALCLLLCALVLWRIPGASADSGDGLCRIKDFSKHGLPGAQMTFSAEEFENNIVSGKTPDSLMLVAVPEPSAGKLLFDGEKAQAGQVIPFKKAGLLLFVPASQEEFSAKIALLPVAKGDAADAAGEQTTVTLNYSKSRDLEPVAGDISVETRVDMEIEITLSGWDPENGPLTYAFGEQKGRGGLEVRDGKVYFTPSPGKTGKSGFSYYVKDSGGNTSELAWVTVEVKKKDYELEYADLAGRPEMFPALMLAKDKVLVGERYGGTLLFRPDDPISRGEFISVAMSAMGVEASGDVALSTPMIETWQSGYMAAALERGITTNMDASGRLTGREAAASALRLLGIKSADPAAEARALGILKDESLADKELSRVQAAELIYRMCRVADGQPLGWKVYSPEK